MTRVTLLKNGLKVASETRFGRYCIAGIAVNSGSRLEASYPSGISHFIERSAFRSTDKFSDREHILEHLSNFGGTLDCQGSRDIMVYAVSVMNEYPETAVELLSEAVFRPRFTDNEVKETANRISFELEDMSYDPERKTQLTEMIHAAAYGNRTLGLPKICPQENLDKITPSLMFNYLKHNHTLDRMVLAGVGIDHEQLVDLAEKYFAQKQPIWLSNPDLPSQQPKSIDRQKAVYTGGFNAIEMDLSNVSLGPTPLPNLAHFQLGFEVCSHLDIDEYVIVCVMNMLMGGGGSFSAGGPGKGMFTRLFTSVLNRYHWIHSCVAHNSSYEDSGIFYIQASSDPGNLKNLVDVVITEYKELAFGRMYKDELARAKKQLISMLLLNLEIRPIVFEDIARQVLATGFRRQPKQLIEKIETVSADDIKRVARKMLASNPSVCCLGDLTHLPPFEYFKEQFTKR
uniref:Mitochondrial-processing peptidase subunit alpha n=1 Tax=Aceria tosichella TaxID=561515 RepID=A0A6G1SML8_9ACAR